MLSRVSVFFEEVAAQTGIGIQQQQLMYLGHDLVLEGSMKVVNLPRTSASQPLILLSSMPESNTSLPFRERKTNKNIFDLKQDILHGFFYLSRRA